MKEGSVLSRDSIKRNDSKKSMGSEIFTRIPEDRYFLVKISIFIIGMTSLLPWNLFITANDYWMYKLRTVDANTSDVNETSDTTTELNSLQAVFTSYLVIASNIPFVIFLFVNTIFAHRVSPTARITWSLGFTILLFIGTASVVYVNTDSAETQFVYGTLASVVVINILGAFLKGASTGIAGFLPKDYMKSYVYGQAMGGIFVSVIQILTLVGNTSPQTSAFAYFLCAVVTLIITMASFLSMVRTEFYSIYYSSQIGKQYQSLTPEETKTARVPLLSLGKQIWVFELATLIVFSVTLSVFPAVLVLVQPDSHSAIGKRFFLPVYCFLIFNVGDIVGRFFASKLTLPGKSGYLELALSCLRVTFIPLFLYCNRQPHHVVPVFFDKDAYFVVFVALFAISNGYIYAVIMTKAPTTVEPQYKETVSSMLALFLGLGIMVGSVISYGTIQF